MLQQGQIATMTFQLLVYFALTMLSADTRQLDSATERSHSCEYPIYPILSIIMILSMYINIKIKNTNNSLFQTFVHIHNKNIIVKIHTYNQ